MLYACFLCLNYWGGGYSGSIHHKLFVPTKSKLICTRFHAILPEATVCWFSETGASGTPGLPVWSGRTRECLRRQPDRPKSVTHHWDLCKCAGHPAGIALSRIEPTGTIGHSEHTIFALRFTHLKLMVDKLQTIFF